MQLWHARHLKAHTLAVRPIDHRMLFVVMQLSDRALIVGVLHAPCNQDEEAGLLFRRTADILCELESKYPKACVLLLGDFNARIGSVAAPGIGPHEPQTENSNGECLRLFLVECGLMAINTFFSNGAGYTWTGSHGHRSSTDYVLCKISIADSVTSCAVDRTIELVSSERDDHNLVMAGFRLAAALDDPSPGKSVRWQQQGGNIPTTTEAGPEETQG